MSKMIKIPTNYEIELIDWDESLSYDEKNKKIVTSIGNDCDYYEAVAAKTLTGFGKDNYLLLIDEEGRLKANKVKVNHIASYLFGDMMFSSIFGNALVARVVETDEGPDIAGIEDFGELYNTLKGIAEKARSI